MTSKNWQLATEGAQRYETILVRAILGPFARALVDWASLPAAGVVLDVGCGTGAATRAAAAQMNPAGKVIGVDVNAGMLRVAQALPPVPGAQIAWRQASAYDLGLADASVDAILCAQSLQFMPQRADALRQMWRVLKPGGALTLSLWCAIEQSPYFAALVEAVATHIDPDTAAGLGSAFNWHDLDDIQGHLRAANFTALTATVAELPLALPPLADFVPRHISATPMGPGYAAASDAARAAILAAMTAALADYQDATGVRVPFRSHLIRAQRPA